MGKDLDVNDILKELESRKNSAPEPQETASPPVQSDEIAENPENSVPPPPAESIPEPAGSPKAPQMQENPQNPEQPPTEAANDLGRQLKGNPQSPAPPIQGSKPLANNDHNKKKKRKKKKKQRSRLPGVLILTTFIFGVSIVLSMVIIGYGKDMLGIGKSEKTHLLIIPENATTEEVAQMLETDGIIKSPDAFKMFLKLRKKAETYVAGEHFVRPNMAYEAIIHELTTVQEEEKGDSVEITFQEGLTIIDAAKILEENGICKADEFIFYFNSGGFNFDFEGLLPEQSTAKFERMEGYLFPDTYFFYENMNPEQVCQKIYLNFNNRISGDFSEGKSRYARMKELNISLDQLITLASIVQKEAANKESMTDVASVFWNRLKHPDVFPKLESDPTSNYANDVIRPNMEVFDATIVNAYDTYKSPGLPPGAICNPGIEAIDAVLTAKESENYYFYANLHTGVTYYAKTIEEQEANIEKVELEYAEESAAAEAAEAEDYGY